LARETFAGNQCSRRLRTTESLDSRTLFGFHVHVSACQRSLIVMPLLLCIRPSAGSRVAPAQNCLRPTVHHRERPRLGTSPKAAVRDPHSSCHRRNTSTRGTDNEIPERSGSAFRRFAPSLVD